LTALRRVATGSQGKRCPRSDWRVEFRRVQTIAARVVMNRDLFLAARRALGMNVMAVRDAASESVFSRQSDRTMLKPLRMDKSTRRRESKTTDLYAELSRALALGKVSLNSEPFCIRVQLTGHTISMSRTSCVIEGRGAGASSLILSNARKDSEVGRHVSCIANA